MNSKTTPLTAILFVVSSLIIANASYVVEADEGINYERGLSELCGDSTRPDQFEYDTQITLVPHRPNSRFDCTEHEMDEIGQQLTIAQQSVLSLGDPRLSSVIEILANVCDNPDMSSQVRRLEFTSTGSGFGFSWEGSGRCRYCKESDSDADHRNLHAEWVPSYFEDVMNEPHRLEQKTDGIMGFVLWNTDDNHDAEPLRSLNTIDRIDLANYGSSMILEAQTSGDVARVVFDIDDTIGFVAKVEAPFFLEDKIETLEANGPSFAEVGQHTITATPYSSTGEELTPVTYLLQVIDTSTLTRTAQGRRRLQSDYTREELVSILEWDLTYHLTAETHAYFYPLYGHCLYRKQVWMMVDLEEIINAQCATDVSCGEHLAASCGECTPPGSDGVYHCAGDCHWNGFQCVEGPQSETVWCGGHSASSCADCPSGNGAAWCNGVCTWSTEMNQCVGP